VLIENSLLETAREAHNKRSPKPTTKRSVLALHNDSAVDQAQFDLSNVAARAVNFLSD
jgi:hypothetical protein